MGASKTRGYTEEQIAISVLLKAMGHPARVAIIDFLLKQKACICKDIVDELPLSQPTISQHLSALKRAGLIQVSIEGSSLCYCLRAEGFRLISQYMAQLSEYSFDDNKSC